MGEAQKRLDATEMWLGDKPDDLKVTTEAHDKAEMPQSGIALAELAAAAQDLVSDLLKEDKKMADKADDRRPIRDARLPFGRPGDGRRHRLLRRAGQIRQRNSRPQEQDGRSNVGRQGMSNGETAASSGRSAKATKT